MTNKTQTMLTIALTAAVSVLMVDRIIEPAQAQDCAPMWQVTGVADGVSAVSDTTHNTYMLVSDLSTEVEIMAMNVETMSLQLETIQMMLD